MASLLSFLPDFIAGPLGLSFASKASLMVTNFFGPPISVKVCGAKSSKAYAFLPSMASVTGGFAFVSHCDTLKVSFVCDQGRCTDSEKIIKMFENNLD
jgi:hypothetical protein